MSYLNMIIVSIESDFNLALKTEDKSRYETSSYEKGHEMNQVDQMPCL